MLNPAGSYTNDDLSVTFVHPDEYSNVMLGVKLFMLLQVHGESTVTHAYYGACEAFKRQVESPLCDACN